ncbi:hypothetical protein HYC85_016799 [Camellia sinensis]|uniref:Myb/SANT-like domain-containing protein n=1 Tax=Camellia sinensis TaxID=4442 RepID=A0A7J7H2U8_CAMSI|nr:hypothetical protein HYC85_016799 [Camellia sinensis]
MASKILQIAVFVFDVIAFALAVAVEQRRSTISEIDYWKSIVEMNGLDLSGPSIHVLTDDQKSMLDLADQIKDPEMKLKFLEICYQQQKASTEPPLIPLQSYTMDDTGTTSSRKKGKPRRFWNHREELFLITTMKDVTTSNPKWKLDNNQFRSVPDAKGMRNRPFPFYEDWLILYGKDKATGELVEDLTDAVAAMEKEDANATTKEGEQSPVEQFSMNMGDTDYSMSIASNVPNRANSTKIGKKGARPTEGIPIELSEMSKNLGSFIENTITTMVEIAHRIGYSHDLSQQRRLVNVELLKLPMSNTQRLMTTSMIVKDEDKVDLFFSLDENDKMEWVSLLLEGHI